MEISFQFFSSRLSQIFFPLSLLMRYQVITTLCLLSSLSLCRTIRSCFFSWRGGGRGGADGGVRKPLAPPESPSLNIYAWIILSTLKFFRMKKKVCACESTCEIFDHLSFYFSLLIEYVRSKEMKWYGFIRT